MTTAVHVTHEAVRKIGGIGAVLQGLVTAKTYNDTIDRTILVGPLITGYPASETRLGKGSELLYSSLDSVSATPLAAKLAGIERAYNVGIVYGRRPFTDRDLGITVFPEVLLFGTSLMNQNVENAFKRRLYNRFGLQSDRYETIGDYEEYLRVAEPAYAALKVLGVGSESNPAFVISHEYMGMPLVLKVLLERDRAFRTIFHAHEVATVRPLVEDNDGHDTMFYNVLEAASASGKYADDVFGSQDEYYKHAFVKRCHLCDGIFAVGDQVVRELRFLGREFREADVELVYNGVPAFEISAEEKAASRLALREYARALLGYKPDYVFSHVTRLVISKGLWRDFRVLEHLDKMFAAEGQTGVLFVLSSQGGVRTYEDACRMESEYGWPANHQMGYPDLVGDEAFFNLAVTKYNERAKAIRAVFVNQFGWSREACGKRMPEGMEFMDIRKGTDLEFGQSIYEPFGISQLEPLSFGALCVVSNVCGCCGFVENTTGGDEVENVIVADYVSLPQNGTSIGAALAIGMGKRNSIEERKSKEVAAEVFRRLPKTPKDFERLLVRGRDLASRMSWEVVSRDYFLPGLERARGTRSNEG